MGKRIEELFRIVEEKTGNNGRIKFSQITQITKAKAGQIQDDPELIIYLKDVATKIIREFSK